MPQGVNGSPQHARVAQIKIESVVFESEACLFGLRHAGGGQFNIGPTGKPVFQVPQRFAVAYEYEFVHERETLPIKTVEKDSRMPHFCQKGLAREFFNR